AVVVISVGAGNAANRSIDIDGIGKQVARAAVIGAVTAGAPQLSVSAGRGESADDSGAVFGVVLENLIGFATITTAIGVIGRTTGNRHSPAFGAIGRGIFTDIVPHHVGQSAVARSAMDSICATISSNFHVADR